MLPLPRRTLAPLLASLLLSSTVRVAQAQCPFDTTLFSAPVTVASAVGTVANAAFADVNLDGIPDLVLAPSGTTGFRYLTMSLTAGHWTGAFSTLNGLTYIASGGKAIATGDLNHDGRTDLVAFDGPNLTATLAPAGGLVNATAANRFITTLNGSSMKVVDFDRDGVGDVVIARGTPGVTLARGVLTGGTPGYAFASIASVVPGGDVRDLALGDFDHNGSLDIAAVTGGNNVAIIPGGVDIFGRPTGTLGTAIPVVAASGARQTVSIAAADLDEDGFDDLVVGVNDPAGPASVVVLMNLGNGTFAAPAPYGTVGQPTSVLTSDLDKDGTLDVIVTTVQGANGAATACLLRGSKVGPPQGYSLGATFPLGTPRNGTFMALADIDNDGANEIAVPSPTSTVVLPGNCLPGVYTIRLETVGPGTLTRLFNSGPVSSGTLVRLSAAGNGKFVGWADDTSGTMNPFLFNASRNRTYRAVFEKFSFPLNVTIDGGGFVTRTPDLPFYPIGTNVTLQAFPDVGYVFTNWSGDATGPNLTTVVTMNGTQNVTAHFTTQAVTLTMGITGSGRVLRAPDLPVYPINSSVVLNAIADDGWVFQNWSGALTSTLNPVELPLSANLTENVTFVRDGRSPLIRAVRDMPGDQGGKVKLEWFASSQDLAGLGNTGIGSYLVFRDVPTSAAQALLKSGAATLLRSPAEAATTGRQFVRTSAAGGDFFWEYVATLPAAGFAGYSYVAATTLDSTAAGPAWTRFMLQARTKDGLTWYNSSPDSGKSVDNLAPAAPAPLAVTAAPSSNIAHWAPSAEPDVAHYRVYRGGTPDFVPSAATRMGEVSDTLFSDATTSSAWYKVTAVDVHGNEGVASAVFAARTTGVPEQAPARLAFTAFPNPGQGRTVFTLALPHAAHARVTVLDANGRRVATLADGEFGPGRWPLPWDGRDVAGRTLSGGLYFALAEVGSERKVSRLVLLR